MANVLYLAGPGSRFRVEEGKTPAGFFVGVWHGLLVVLTFLLSLATNRVRIYETENRGRRYDFGFLVGIGLLGPISVWIGPYRLL